MPFFAAQRFVGEGAQAALARALGGRREAVLAVPTRQAVAPYRAAIAALGCGVGASVLPLRAFVSDLTRPLPGPPPVGRVARAALLAALLEVEGLPPAYGSAAALFSELGWQAVGPAAVERLAREAGAEELLLLAHIYARYLGLLADLGRADPDQRIGAALAGAAAAPQPALAVPAPFDQRLEAALAVLSRQGRVEALELQTPEPATVERVANPTPQQEAAALAARVDGWLKRGERVALASRKPAATALRLGRPFAQAGLGIALQTAFPLLESPAGAAVRGALLAARGEGEVEDLLAVLRLAGEPGWVAHREAAAVKAGLEEAGELLPTLLREEAGRPLRELREADNPYVPLADLCGRLGLRLAARANEHPTPPLVGQGQGLAAARSSLLELAELVERLEQPELAAAARSLPCCEAALRAARCPLQSFPLPGEPAVLLAAPWELGGLSCDRLVVVGLEEGLLPAEPPLFAASRQLLAAAGLIPISGERAERERRLLELLRGVGRELSLSYATAAESGQPKPPQGAALELVGDLEPAAAQAAGAGPLPATVQEPLERFPHRPAVVQATDLELYLRCPNRWLLERRLALDTVAPEGPERGEGALLHELLAEVLKELANSYGPTSLGPGLCAEGFAALQAAVEARRGRLGGGVGEALLFARCGRLLERLLPHLLKQLEGRQLVALELAFGPGEEVPPLELGGLLVSGRIDRIDCDPAGRAVLVDYKRSLNAKLHPGEKWLGSGTVQVAIYAEVVSRHLGMEVVGGLYQPLTGKDLRPRGLLAEAIPGFQPVRTDVVDRSRFEEQRTAILAALEAAAAEFAAGELGARPHSCGSEGCAYPDLCLWLQGP